LPLEATKGEILTVVSKELPENELLNRKCFILPVGDQQFKIGATYSWRSPNTELTDEAKEELLQHADSLTNAHFEIIKHEAGVRPTTIDRRPMMGKHPEFPKLKIFNGLGAKGYMTAPLLSQEFVAYLKNGISLDKEIDIQRCEKLRTKG
jgi:glycine oxidase